MGWDLDTNTPPREPEALSCRLASLALVTDVLTLKICTLECKDHQDGVPCHLTELDLEGLGVPTVSRVLLHQQSPNLGGNIYPRRIRKSQVRQAGRGRETAGQGSEVGSWDEVRMGGRGQPLG